MCGAPAAKCAMAEAGPSRAVELAGTRACVRKGVSESSPAWLPFPKDPAISLWLPSLPLPLHRRLGLFPSLESSGKVYSIGIYMNTTAAWGWGSAHLARCVWQCPVTAHRPTVGGRDRDLQARSDLQRR